MRTLIVRRAPIFSPQRLQEEIKELRLENDRQARQVQQGRQEANSYRQEIAELRRKLEQAS